MQTLPPIFVQGVPIFMVSVLIFQIMLRSLLPTSSAMTEVLAAPAPQPTRCRASAPLVPPAVLRSGFMVTAVVRRNRTGGHRKGC